MELSEYTEGLRREVAAVTRLADEEVARAGQLITESLDSSIRLTLLDVLSGAAAEITSRLDDIAVELRLSSGNPTFAIVDTRENPDVPEPPAPPRPPVGPFNLFGPPGPPGHGEGEEETGTSRVTLRLPDGLKARAEAAAARDGLSLNAWLVRAASRALGDEGGPARTRSARRGPGTRITGYARS